MSFLEKEAPKAAEPPAAERLPAIDSIPDESVADRVTFPPARVPSVVLFPLIDARVSFRMVLIDTVAAAAIVPLLAPAATDSVSMSLSDSADRVSSSPAVTSESLMAASVVLLMVLRETAAPIPTYPPNASTPVIELIAPVFSDRSETKPSDEISEPF